MQAWLRQQGPMHASLSTPCQPTRHDATPGTLGMASRAAPSVLTRKQDRQSWGGSRRGADRPILGVP
eukprot:7465557-Alexandrium_andersonii.AAC.1